MATEPLPLKKTESPGPAAAPEDAVPAAARTGEPLVRFDKVVKRYGDHVVLDELDFTVDRGEHVTLIGLDLVRTLKASRWQVLRKIRFPNAVPYIFVGLKLAATMSVNVIHP